MFLTYLLTRAKHKKPHSEFMWSFISTDPDHSKNVTQHLRAGKTNRLAVTDENFVIYRLQSTNSNYSPKTSINNKYTCKNENQQNILLKTATQSKKSQCLLTLRETGNRHFDTVFTKIVANKVVTYFYVCDVFYM